MMSLFGNHCRFIHDDELPVDYKLLHAAPEFPLAAQQQEPNPTSANQNNAPVSQEQKGEE
jgi:hypothetical protein